MREFFNEKDGFQFYSILFNEFNSVKNTEQNAADLINFLNYVGGERDRMILEAAKMLGVLKNFAFSNKVIDEHSADFADAIAVALCAQQIFNDKCKKLDSFANDFSIERFTFNILRFVTTDVFSQNNPMNNLGETFMNLLNASCDSNNPQPTPPATYYKFEVMNKNVGICNVEIVPEIPDDSRYKEGSNIKITVTNGDPIGYNTLLFLGVYDAPDPSDPNTRLILDLATEYDSVRGNAAGEFNIEKDSYLYIEFKKP